MFRVETFLKNTLLDAKRLLVTLRDVVFASCQIVTLDFEMFMGKIMNLFM
jgi:hypothetical protein